VGPSARAADTVDEIHYSYGETPDSVVFDWHGGETTLSYGLDSTYGSQAVAAPSAVTPVDTTGPFMEVKLTGLQPGTTYHYQIGVSGLDHTFTTTPTGNFTWVDVGDTGSTLCSPWLAQTQSLIAAQSPAFVTHGGDISYENECGPGAVHQYYNDQQVWSAGSAFQPVWGNHEYGSPNAESRPGAVRDSMLNYKGRSYVTNAQTVPNDTVKQLSAPGCAWETSATANTCLGEDWGWFVAGHVMFISMPEPWSGAIADWRAKAASLMSTAQADPTIDFVVTYGHRPGYSSVSASVSADVRTALTALAQSYSPSAGNPTGKYVLNVAHHVHGDEVFAPINGLVNITDGGGGQSQVTYDATPDPNSVFRTVHPSILRGLYDATAHTLQVDILCGPVYTPSPKQPCTYGSVLTTMTFTHNPNSTPQPTVTTAISDGVTSLPQGQSSTYTVTANDPVAGTSTSGTVSAVVPAGAAITAAPGGTIDPSGTSVSWPVDSLTGGTPVTHQLTVQPAAGATSMTVTAQASTGDNTCSNPGSSCVASDTDTIVPPTTQWVLNPSVESDLSGWTGHYGPSPYVTVTRDTTTPAHTGVASIKVAATTGATNLQSGFNDNPRWVQKTVAGTTYTQSAWVRPTFVGQKIIMRLREWSGGTLVTDKAITLVASSTGWQQMSQSLVAARANDQLAFALYAVISANQSFNADDLSLTSPN
ncbi:MAG: metallophosphoesterase family protein, partial [Frankiales bacterium]|nr:metallophosphoesterase family protein [Frankiales bacterium]